MGDEDGIEMLDEAMENFLRARKISEYVISNLRKEKIDSQVLLLMSDEHLSHFLPCYGDRLALRQYCKPEMKTAKKQGLLDKLRKKIKRNRKTDFSSSSDESTKENKKSKLGNAKDTRQVELGWLCSENGNRYVQIRTKQGGGTRKIAVSKSAKKDMLTQKAVEFFFPNGVSTKGHINKFSIELWDFKSNIVNNDLTIEEMYCLSGLARLRFYLATKEKCSTIVTAAEQSESVKCIATSDELYQQLINKTVEWEYDQSENIENKSATACSTIALLSDDEDKTDKENSLFIHSSVLDELTQAYSITDDIYIQNAAQENLPLNNSMLSNENDRVALSTEGLPYEITKIVLHRGRIFEELLEVFQYKREFNKLQIEMVLPSGEIEQAHDIGGVFRDCFSEFWQTFYEKCTVGTTWKVPYLRHDFGQNKWSAIAEILVTGWNDEGYFPIKIAPVFIENCLGITSNNNDLIENFLNFISETERNVLKKALTDFESAEFDDILECLDNFECKQMPMKDNFQQLITEIAHKELIQKPMFIIKCFQGILKKLNVKNLKQIYKDCEPNAKNVLAHLQISEKCNVTSDVTTVYGYLKKFIREGDDKIRSAFLRFCTGSDLVCNKIKVSFTANDGFARTPIAHTCTGLLEIPSSYENFLDFRSEFTNILTSNVWIMDIV